MRPRLKPLYPARDGDTLRLIQEPGVYFDLPDETGQIAAMLEVLDGSRTVPDVHRALRTTWPDLTEHDVTDAVKALDAAGLLVDEDAETAVPQPEVDRYASNLAFLSTFSTFDDSAYRMHERLRQSHVVLLGAGGLGSTLLLSLAGAGVGRLTVLDKDKVELKNLTRQFLYTTEDVGYPKIDRALARARAVNPDIRIDGVSRWVTEPGDVLPLLDGADLVLCGIDKPYDIRRVVGRACVAAGVPMLTGGMWATRGMYYGFDPARTGCLDCWKLENHKAGQRIENLPVAAANRAMGPVAAVVSGMIGMEAVRLLTGCAEPVSLGRMWIIDFVTGATSVFREWTRQPDCPTCGQPG
jgi:molybdopterin/thiamine biosynthesis adenylyltransferase